MAGQWGVLYRFTLHPQQPVDFEYANWYTSDPSGLVLRQQPDRRDPRRRLPLHLVQQGVPHAASRMGGGDAGASKMRNALAAVLREQFGITVSTADAAALSAVRLARAPQRFLAGGRAPSGCAFLIGAAARLRR